MNSKHVSYLMTGGLVTLLLAVMGVAYVANGLLEKQAGTLKELKLRSQVLESEQNSLIKAKKDVEKYRSLDTIARTIVPQDKDQAEAVREIVKMAGESGISPSSITFPASSLGSPAGAKPAAGANLTQLTPVKDYPGLHLLQITISQDASSPVPYPKFIEFLGRLEQNRRTSQVSSIVLQPSSSDRNMLSFTLTVDKYIKP